MGGLNSGLLLPSFLYKMKKDEGCQDEFTSIIPKRKNWSIYIELVRLPRKIHLEIEKAAAQFLKPLLSKNGFKVKTVLSPKEGGPPG